MKHDEYYVRVPLLTSGPRTLLGSDEGSLLREGFYCGEKDVEVVRW